jgi:hypothetical protein
LFLKQSLISGGIIPDNVNIYGLLGIPGGKPPEYRIGVWSLRGPQEKRKFDVHACFAGMNIKFPTLLYAPKSVQRNSLPMGMSAIAFVPSTF